MSRAYPRPSWLALLRQWIDEQDGGNMIALLCQENDAIPLDGNQIYVWTLRTDGQALCIHHESFAQRAELEENAQVAYDMIEAGAKRQP